MNLELDHVFILVKPEARVADLLIAKGFEEGTQNIHPGQREFDENLGKKKG